VYYTSSQLTIEENKKATSEDVAFGMVVKEGLEPSTPGL
jgi:hypothetical protein